MAAGCEYSRFQAKNCNENSRMCKISYSKFPPKCAHARILVAIFGQPTGNRLYNYKSTISSGISFPIFQPSLSLPPPLTPFHPLSCEPVDARSQHTRRRSEQSIYSGTPALSCSCSETRECIVLPVAGHFISCLLNPLSFCGGCFTSINAVCGLPSSRPAPLETGSRED